jgi:hypothetical protein
VYGRIDELGQTEKAANDSEGLAHEQKLWQSSSSSSSSSSSAADDEEVVVEEEKTGKSEGGGLGDRNERVVTQDFAEPTSDGALRLIRVQ